MKLPSLGVRVVGQKRLRDLEEESTRLKHELSILRVELGRHRIGFKPLNLINITSELRGRVEGSLTLDYDGNKIELRGDRPLEEAEYNLVVSILGFELNGT